MNTIKGITILMFGPNINGTSLMVLCNFYIKSWHYIANPNRICRSLETFASSTMDKSKCMNELEAQTYSFVPEHYKVKPILNYI